jgi:hypothetical protein
MQKSRAGQDRKGEERRDGIIEFIAEGGVGSEAGIIIELRTKFPGIGGNILTSEGAVSALREEFHPTPRAGHAMFLRHLIIKKLEDYFFRTQVYKVSHIPRPFGSISREGDKPYEAYLYEWVYGDEGFPWQVTDYDGSPSNVTLRDWNAFIGVFNDAGIDLLQDCTDPDDGRMSKNIIYQFNRRADAVEMSSIWKRIDFGFRSISINYDKLARFLYDNRKSLISVMRVERYEMVELALECLTKRECMSGINIGKLEVLTGDYRRATLGHYISRGSGIGGNGVIIGERTESLI